MTDYATVAVTEMDVRNFVSPPLDYDDVSKAEILLKIESVETFAKYTYFGGGTVFSQLLIGSRINDFSDFAPGTSAADPFIYNISADDVNGITYLSPGRVLIVGTPGGEFIMSASNLEELKQR